jgi:hypothetical protein
LYTLGTMRAVLRVMVLICQGLLREYEDAYLNCREGRDRSAPPPVGIGPPHPERRRDFYSHLDIKSARFLDLSILTMSFRSDFCSRVLEPIRKVGQNQQIQAKLLAPHEVEDSPKEY